jgi:hypothetical protein
MPIDAKANEHHLGPRRSSNLPFSGIAPNYITCSVTRRTFLEPTYWFSFNLTGHEVSTVTR